MKGDGRRKIKKLLYNLEVSEKVLVLAPEYPLVCKILGSVVKDNLERLIPLG